MAGQLVRDESVPERRVVGVDRTGSVDEMRVVLITLRDRIAAPLVERLSRESEHPAGHRDGNPVVGKVEDQREHHFGLTCWDR